MVNAIIKLLEVFLNFNKMEYSLFKRQSPESFSVRSRIIFGFSIAITSALLLGANTGCALRRRLLNSKNHIPVIRSFITPPSSVLPVGAAQGPFEDAPLLSATQLLGRQSLATSYYSIDPSVRNDGYMNRYEITSPFGNSRPVGREMMLIAIDELRALKQIDMVSTSKILYDTVSDQTLGLLTAPVRALIYTGKVIINPDKLLNTASEVPGGIERIGTTVQNKVGAGSETVSAVVREAEEEVGGNSILDTSIRAVSRTGERFLGYRRRYADWLIRLRVDPSTRNKRLTDEVSDLAWLETSIDFGFNFFPGLPGVAAVGTFNRYHRRAQQIAEFNDEGVLDSKMWRELTKLGIEGTERGGFFKHPFFTATNRLRVIESLRMLPKLKNKAYVVKLANQANDDSHAFFYATMAEQLVDISTRLSPVVRMDHQFMVPIAHLENGQTILVLPVDYITWTRDVALLINDITSRIELIRPLVLWTTGLVSPIAQTHLGELHIELAMQGHGSIGIPSPEIVNYQIWEDGEPEDGHGISLHPRIKEILPDW
jgi:hypothetical protein